MEDAENALWQRRDDQHEALLLGDDLCPLSQNTGTVVHVCMALHPNERGLCARLHRVLTALAIGSTKRVVLTQNFLRLVRQYTRWPRDQQLRHGLSTEQARAQFAFIRTVATAVTHFEENLLPGYLSTQEDDEQERERREALDVLISDLADIDPNEQAHADAQSVFALQLYQLAPRDLDVSEPVYESDGESSTPPLTPEPQEEQSDTDELPTIAPRPSKRFRSR